eukprot:TRINITY_DN3195_c0_g1_i2.p1 TRINITY_DN3195_c0_g1~~TRINITY_DN3195_c0_g1_i2.p1  ORF type:complete len:196 (-),score=58.93 TRINITY_DN3195_c0_g1_i2:581-1093(-)
MADFNHDFFNYADRMEAHMRDRFDAMNRSFEEAARQQREEQQRLIANDPNAVVTTNTYSKSVTRHYNGDADCGEEIIVERDTKTGTEVKTHSRRIGERSIQVTTTKNLNSGDEVCTTSRHNLPEWETKEFDQQWNALEDDHIVPHRAVLHDHHFHHHPRAAPHQLKDKQH